ncbi:hypothetical protein FKM82_020327 [Ascaphus truei]
MAYTSHSHPQSYYDNVGFHRENLNAYRQPTAPNAYVSYPPPHSYPSPVPHYIPQVSPHQSVPVTQHAKSQTCCTARTKKIACIVTTICVLVAAAIIAAVLCWYFVTSRNEKLSGKACGSSGSYVSSSQWCDGTPQCPKGEDEIFCVRLYGPNFQLQAYSSENSAWLPVCSAIWNDNFGKAACKDMGYSTSSYYKSDTILATPGSNGFMNLNTSSGNSKLFNLLYNSKSCSSGRVVSLRCICKCCIRESLMTF